MANSLNVKSFEEEDRKKGEILPLKKAKDSQQVTPAQDTSLLERLKKSGLDPQKLLDVTLPNLQSRPGKKRHYYIRLSFLLMVALPTAFFTLYMFFAASDQYHSSVAFAVRSSNNTAATEVLGMVLDSGGESTTSNSYIVHDYLKSQAALEDIKKTVDLENVFSKESSDWLFRMSEELPIEDQLKYWNSMVDVSFDSTSGVIFVNVRSFDPGDSVLLAEQIHAKSETLVNRLSETNRRQSVQYAEVNVAKAETRLKAIRKQLLAYRDKTQEVSPEENARITSELIGELDAELSAKEAARTTLLSYLNEDSPRIRIINQEISALEAQIAKEKKRLGSGEAVSAEDGGRVSSISTRIADYSDLKLEEEFANQLYITALAGLEKARQDADQKSMYLATFIPPTLSQDAQYPSRWLWSISVLLLLSGLWITAVLMYYNIRDRT